MGYVHNSSWGISAEVRTTVCGGFPVIAKCVFRPEDPSAGWLGEVTDLEVLTLKGKPCPWIEKKMTVLDWEKVECVLWDKGR